MSAVSGFIQGLTSVYDSAVLDDNLEHTGGITLSWKAAAGTSLPVGTSVYLGGVKYSLLDPYAPEKNDAVSWRYSPKFLHPVARLDRVPFYINVQSEEEVEQVETINFTGTAKTIADKLADHFSVYGATDSEFATTFGIWTADVTQNENTVITVNFDGCSIKAAASRIADALGCNVFFDWQARKIRFIAGSTIEGATYNCFHVLGGTTNMAKKSISDIMVPVTKRLTLPDTYPGSIIDHCPSGGIKLTTNIILDDIYPKMELLIKSVRERSCYVTNEVGEKQKDGNGHYKLYSKFYIKLKYTDDTDFSMNDVQQIADKPLSLLFQPDLEHFENSSVLAGHQFELVHYGSNATEWGTDDVLPEESPWQAAAGEFRIVFKAEGSQILPSTSAQGLSPAEGDKVTLVNVSLSDHYKEIAQGKLLSAANGIIAMMEADNGSYKDTVLEGGSLVAGQSYTTGDGHSGIITDINLNLDTGVAEVTVGSWRSRKTLTGGMVDKIDSINITGGGGTTGEKGMSKTQFDALNMTGAKYPTKEKIDLLGVDIDAIRQQEDKQFNIWFGSGTPTASNYPAEDWTTDEEKALHEQDLYYDTTRTPASTGGRAWRYLKNGNTYGWQPVTDLDTMASLEKIADVASDGVICAGAEKQRVLIDWHNCMREYKEYSGIDSLQSLTEYSTYISAYQALWQLLNGGSAPNAGNNQTYETVPAWVAGGALYEDTYLEDDYSGTIPTGMTIEQLYRQVWNDYYQALTALLAVSDAQGIEALATAKSKMAVFVNYSLPDPPYKRGDLWWKLHSEVPGNNNGDLYICINARVTGDTPDMSDWMHAGDYLASSASLMGKLAELLEANISRKYTNNNHKVVVSWGGTAPESPSTGDVWYDSVNKAINEYSGSEWTAVDPYEVDVPNTKTVFEALRRIDQQQDRSVNFWDDPSNAGNSAETFDVAIRRSRYVDNLTGRTINGELGIWLYGYGTDGWAHEKDNVSGILTNYGDQIIAAVFGDNIDPTDPLGEIGIASWMAGFTTTLNFASMFAQKAVVDQDGNSELKAKAGIAVHIESETDPSTGDPVDKGYVDIEGSFRSADKKVVIDRVHNPYISGAFSTLLKFYQDDPGQTPGTIPDPVGDSALTVGVLESLDYSSGTPRVIPSPFIRLRDEIGGLYSHISSDQVVSPVFKIVYYDSNLDDIEVLNGVGTAAFPETFETADGKTVTVIGGIITDIS